MASYWRALWLSAIVSVAFGLLVYLQFPPSVSWATGAGVITFSGMTTLLAIWCLIRRQKGDAGWLLVTAAASPTLYLLYAVGVLIFIIVTNGPMAQLGYAYLDLGIIALYMIAPALWIATGICLIRLDRRQRLFG